MASVFCWHFDTVTVEQGDEKCRAKNFLVLTTYVHIVSTNQRVWCEYNHNLGLPQRQVIEHSG